MENCPSNTDLEEPFAQLIQGEVKANVEVLNELALSLGEQPVDTFPEKPYLEEELQRTSAEYIKNASLFSASIRTNFSIDRIMSVNNIFNTLHYRLAKEKYGTVYTENCSETVMFHGTKQDFLDGICTYNFDRSKIRTHKFGCGISFAAQPFYATHYHHDNKRRRNKVMIIAKVLVGCEFEIGNLTMAIPKRMTYTSKNTAQTVIVKYDDHSFLPIAVLHYQGLHQQKTEWLLYDKYNKYDDIFGLSDNEDF